MYKVILLIAVCNKQSFELERLGQNNFNYELVASSIVRVVNCHDTTNDIYLLSTELKINVPTRVKS